MTLDEAWAEAEAVLPEGWQISLTHFTGNWSTGWLAQASAGTPLGGLRFGNAETAEEAMAKLTGELGKMTDTERLLAHVESRSLAARLEDRDMRVSLDLGDKG